MRHFSWLLATLFTVQLSATNLTNIQTIKSVQQQYLAGSLTSEQLVNHYIKKIEHFDKNGKQLNSIAQLNPNALKRAKALDAQLKTSGLIGALHGIPVLLKDNIDTVDGMANTAGSHALATNFPTDDAFLVKQLKAAGAIILGKANLSEWANFRSTASSSGWSGMWGQTKNPYDATRSPCGSSSGSGVAVAAGFTLLAVGTETDGSVTCPSAINGVVGIKPTLGTISRDGIIPIAHSQDTAGPMATTVTDAVILLSAMVAHDEKDVGAEKSSINYINHLKVDGLKGKRIGVVRNLMGYHNGLDNTFELAIEDLKAQGAVIVDDLSFDNKNEWSGAEFEVLLYEFKHGLKDYLKNTSPELPKSLSDIIKFNKQHADIEMPYFGQELMLMAQNKGDLTEKAYIDALKAAKNGTQAKGIDKLLAEHQLDLLIAPTTGPAWKIDNITGDHYLGAASSAAAISGYPHITVPMGYVHGLPVGISFFSGKLQEDVLIEAAYSYEQATQHRVAPKL